MNAMICKNAYTLQWLPIDKRTTPEYIDYWPDHFSIVKRYFSGRPNKLKGLLGRLSPKITSSQLIMRHYFRSGLPFISACEAYINNEEMMVDHATSCSSIDFCTVGDMLSEEVSRIEGVN